MNCHLCLSVDKGFEAHVDNTFATLAPLHVDDNGVIRIGLGGVAETVTTLLASDESNEHQQGENDEYVFFLHDSTILFGLKEYC